MSSQPIPHNKEVTQKTAKAYWKANIQLLCKLMVVWFAVSFGAGILFVDQLNKVVLFGFPLGFWFAQQGSTYVFVALIFIYVIRMNKIERSFGIHD